MEEKKFLNETIINIRWVDIDMYSHLNNSKFFDYMVESRADFLGPFINEFKNIRYVLSETKCSFKKEFKYPSKVKIKQFCISNSAASFELLYEFYEENNDVLRAEGYAKLVCIDADKGKPCKIPESLLTILTK